MDDTRARFLAAIATHVPAERVAEVHLFASIRQGGMESGVAVLALDRPAEPAGSAEPVAVAEPVPESDAAAPPPTRYSVYTARYRHTLKGLERGKWEVSVTEEALAPLRTIDAVVRGVQRRSGDVDEITHLSGDDFRAMLPVEASR